MSNNATIPYIIPYAIIQDHTGSDDDDDSTFDVLDVFDVFDIYTGSMMD